MPLRRFSLPAAALPKPARPPLAVAFVGGMIALLISTGHAAAGEPSVDARPAAATGPASATGATVAAAGMLAPPGAVTRALDALAPAGSRSSDRASRSAHRKPLADTPPAHRWVRPNGGPLTSRFGYRWGRLHAGIDLAGPYGSAIVAATDGCITYAGPESGYGEILKMTDWTAPRPGTRTCRRSSAPVAA